MMSYWNLALAVFTQDKETPFRSCGRNIWGTLIVPFLFCPVANIGWLNSQ
jgi:hypothetical protein